MPRKVAPGIAITANRLPAEVQPFVPEGLDGLALADWFLTFEAGRRFGQSQAQESEGRYDIVLRSIRDRLEELTEQVGQAPAASAPAPPKLSIATRETFEPPPPPPPDTILLTAEQQGEVMAFVQSIVADPDRLPAAMAATERLLLGYIIRPDGEQVKGPAWTAYPSRGFQEVVYKMLMGQGLVPKITEDGEDWSRGWKG